MGIIKEYKLYKMQELESNDLESSDVDEENPDFDISDLDDDIDDIPDEENLDFDISDLDDAEFSDDVGIDDLDGEGAGDLDGEDDFDMSDLDDEDDGMGDEFSDEMDDEDPDFDMSDLDDEDGDIEGEGGEGEDADFQGDIRNVSGACLIYKRVAEDSTYEELWVYNVGKDINTEVKIRRAILAGTDIKPQLGRSEDGQQTVKIWSMGNVQYLNIFGLPN